jgi:hypothetical protein
LKVFSSSLPSVGLIFGNVNAVTEAHLQDDLNIKPLQKAVKVMRVLINQLNLAQSNNSPFPNMSSMVARNSTSTWSNSLPSVPVSNTPTPEISVKPCREKCNPVSADKKAKAAANQCQKEPCCSSANKSTKNNVSDMEMFYLHRPDMKAATFFQRISLTEYVLISYAKAESAPKRTALLLAQGMQPNFRKQPSTLFAATLLQKKLVG